MNDGTFFLVMKQDHGFHTPIVNFKEEIEDPFIVKYISDAIDDLHHMETTRIMSIDVKKQYFLIVKTVPLPAFDYYMI